MGNVVKNTTVVDADNSTYSLEVDSKGSAHVLPQENTEQIVNGLVSQSTGIPYALGAEAVIDSYTLTLAGGHPFIAGDFIVIAEDDRIYQGQVLSVATNVLTLDTPIDYAFPLVGSVAFEVSNDMTVDGSVTRQVFKIGTPNTVLNDVHYRGIRINITDATTMDDGKFGGIAALTRGIIFRIVKDDGRRFNICNAKNNGDLGLFFDNKVYSDKGGGGGVYSVEFTWKTTADDGAVINIEAGDQIEVIIQDDLTGLVTFRIWAFGHLNGVQA